LLLSIIKYRRPTLNTVDKKREEILRRLENARQEIILCYEGVSNLKEEVKNTAYPNKLNHLNRVK
jgi:hypothetical protein